MGPKRLVLLLLFCCSPLWAQTDISDQGDANGDSAGGNSGVGFDSTNPYIGEDTGGYWWAARWDLNIPASATVNTCTFTVECGGEMYGSGATGTIIRAEDETDQPVYSDTAGNRPWDLSLDTTASQTWTWAAQACDTAAESLTSPDIAAIIQEVVDDSWCGTPPCQVRITVEDDSSGGAGEISRVCSYESATGCTAATDAPVINVNYTAAAAGTRRPHGPQLISELPRTVEIVAGIDGRWHRERCLENCDGYEPMNWGWAPPRYAMGVGIGMPMMLEVRPDYKDHLPPDRADIYALERVGDVITLHWLDATRARKFSRYLCTSRGMRYTDTIDATRTVVRSAIRVQMVPGGFVAWSTRAVGVRYLCRIDGPSPGMEESTARPLP